MRCFEVNVSSHCFPESRCRRSAPQGTTEGGMDEYKGCSRVSDRAQYREIGQSGAEVYDIEGQYLLKRVREVYFSMAEGYERLKAGSIAG